MKKVETNKETLKFDLVSTLILIGSDKDLTTIFTNKYSDDFKLHVATAKGGLTKKSTIKYIESIFTNIVLKRKEYVDSYKKILEKQEKESSKTKLPKWYGKKKVLADIESQDGKMTEQQRMMLKVNDLKNIFSKLNRKGINCTLGDSEMSDKDCRTVIASIVQLENKLKNIL